MKNSLKKFYATLLMVILIMVFSAPFTAFAEAGTLGSENPVLSATFKDGDDVVVDGNELEAGSYTVDITLSGMKAVSIFQITANISNITINSVKTIADVDSSFSCGAIVNENNSFVAILASENDGTSAIADGAAMVTLNVTVNTAGDFANMFALSTDPDLTFVEADYGDGYDDAYVTTENTSAKYALMTYDMSPDLAPTTFSVSGQITNAVDPTGEATTFATKNVTVSIDGTDISAVTDENGYYTLSGLAEGTYTMSITGQTTIDRKVTLVVDGDKTVDAVGVIICDYNKDGFVTTADAGYFISYLDATADYFTYADINNDGFVLTSDAGFIVNLFTQAVDYSDVTL